MKNYAISLMLLIAAASARAAAPDALVTVDGAPISRTQAMELSFRRCGGEVVNALIEDVLQSQAVKANGVVSDPKEVAARLKRISAQFPDEATMRTRLSESGASLEALRAQLEHDVLRERLVAKVKKVSVTDAEVRQFYEANREKLAQSPALRLRHLLVATENEARDFATALRAGADFARLAASVSLDQASKARGGDLGFVSSGMTPPDIEKAVFALKPGEVSAPVPSPSGFHIFKLEESRPGKAANFKEIQADLKRNLIVEKTAQAWKTYAQELRAAAKIEIAPAAAPAPPGR
ncbi:MAG: peptidyl-prolyl cis-trans isomerase [Elusimicrobia bacterium]|nr:peptidyl-prolyl cis-trans isomerase [Elusimicrobiota bacterium]